MPFWMMLTRQMTFAPDGAGAGAGAGDPPPAGAGAGAGDPPPAGAGAGAGDPSPAGAAPKWWEALPEDQRNYLVATGRTKDDPLEVIPQIIKDYQHAERRLGHKPGDLITKPKEGQSVNEWLAEQRDKLGLPDKPDAYKIDPPQDWPKEIPWDADMAGKVRQIAFDNGLPPDAVNAMVAVYADKVREMEQASAAALQVATDAMMADLQKDWGPQTAAKIAQAKQAAGVIAEKAGLSAEALQNLTGVLADKTGDANVLRMFSALAEMMGDDTALGLGKGAQTFTMTPADARAEIDRISAPDGEYAKAIAGTDLGEKQRWYARMEQLTRIAAQK